VQNAYNELPFANTGEHFPLSISLPLINDYLLAAKHGSEEKEEICTRYVMFFILTFIEWNK
jgi:hypothetical protein